MVPAESVVREDRDPALARRPSVKLLKRLEVDAGGAFILVAQRLAASALRAVRGVAFRDPARAVEPLGADGFQRGARGGQAASRASSRFRSRAARTPRAFASSFRLHAASE